MTNADLLAALDAAGDIQDVAGILHDPEQPVLTLEAIDEAIAHGAAEADSGAAALR